VIGGCGPGALFELRRVELRCPPTAAAVSPNSSGPLKDLPTRRWQAEGGADRLPAGALVSRPAATWPIAARGIGCNGSPSVKVT
jgi:hypothetical protein